MEDRDGRGIGITRVRIGREGDREGGDRDGRVGG